jgi:hypothetical protein
MGLMPHLLCCEHVAPEMRYAFFDVLLTVQLSIILVIVQINAQILVL